MFKALGDIADMLTDEEVLGACCGSISHGLWCL